MERFFRGTVTFFVLFMFVFLAACGTTTTSSTTNTTTASPTTLAPTTTEEPTTLAPTTLAPTTSITTTSGVDTQITTTTDNGGTSTTTSNTNTSTTETVAATYVFEAEYTYLDELFGAGYSGTQFGTGMIVEDSLDAGASNGHYVSYLYVSDIALVFEIESDRAVNNAQLVLRLSAEVMDITLTSETYSIIVNNTAIAYDDIEFIDVPIMPEILPFRDIVIGNISLIQGTNIIELVTSNSDGMQGTMYATAPIVDCIKITTDAILTWDELTENIPG